MTAAALLATAGTAEAAAGNAAFQDIVKNGADPTGQRDSSAAFVKASNKLPASGGTVFCPAGVYLLSHPVFFSNKPLQVVGMGSAATMFLMGHSGTAFTFTSTAAYPSTYPFQIVGLGIAGPTGGAPAATGAIAVNFPPALAETGYQSCYISDIDIGISAVNVTNGSNITTGLALNNICKSEITNVRMFGINPRNATFVRLISTDNGYVNDNRFVSCSCDGVSNGYVFSAVNNSLNVALFQGVHLIEPLIISDTGVATSFNGIGNANVLGLYIRGGEIVGSNVAADLYRVTAAYISDTHFGCSNLNASAVITMEGCFNVGMSNLTISGAYPSQGGGGGSVFGINLGGTACRLSGILFINLALGLQFMANAAANLALGLQLISEQNFPRLQTGPAAVDSSGTLGVGVNNAQWMVDSGQLITLY